MDYDVLRYVLLDCEYTPKQVEQILFLSQYIEKEANNKGYSAGWRDALAEE